MVDGIGAEDSEVSKYGDEKAEEEAGLFHVFLALQMGLVDDID